jgi:hypothetical protein
MGRCTWQQILAWKNFKIEDKRKARKYKDIQAPTPNYDKQIESANEHWNIK